MLNIFKKKTNIILDTNFLMIPGELGIDIFTQIHNLLREPYELCVLDKTIEELEKLISKSSKSKIGLNSKLALILIKQKNLKTLPASREHYADKALIDYAQKNPENTIIATQDKDLKTQIKKTGARIISLRQKKYVAWGG